MIDNAFNSATALAAAIRDGRTGCREALDFYLERVGRLNPGLNAVIAQNTEAARERADAADAALAAGESWGPLHGVPMTVKDTYEAAGMTCVVGAPALADYRPKRNATAVQRLLDAGAVIFGKTNTPLYAQDIQSYNAVFGTTNNPWDPTRTPGGSSGGAAAATAAGLTAFELGSDIGGSIRTPAHWCGVYGHKPSHGIIPLRGHIPGPPGTVAEPDLAVAGPLARAAEDLALALDVLAGPGKLDAAGWQLRLPPPRHTRLADFRVACWFDDPSCRVDRATRECLGQTAAALREAGAQVTDEPPMPVSLQEAFELYEQLLNAVLGSGLPGKTYRGIRRAAPMMRWFGLDRSARLGGFMNAATQSFRHWAACHEARERQREAWSAFFDDYDVLLMPVTPGAAIPHTQRGNLFNRRIEVDGNQRRYFDQFVWIAPPTSALLPATAAPVGRGPTGLPIGMQVVGSYLGDRSTIEFARLLAERIGGFTPPPGF